MLLVRQEVLPILSEQLIEQHQKGFKGEEIRVLKGRK
jgi:hypothetical protein